MQLDDEVLLRLIHGDITCWTVEDALLYGRAVQALANDSVYTEMVASCQCLTKSPEPQCHARNCRYRILHEIQALLLEKKKT